MTEGPTAVVRSAPVTTQRTVKLTKGGNPRPPRGWKRQGDDYYSPEGWRSLYRMRIVQIPIAGISRPPAKFF